MGLFRKHDPAILAEFERVYQDGKHETESQFLESLNGFTVMIEKSKDYSTNSKLLIYELLSQISNCSPSERNRYYKKLKKALK